VGGTGNARTRDEDEHGDTGEQGGDEISEGGHARDDRGGQGGDENAEEEVREGEDDTECREVAREGGIGREGGEGVDEERGEGKRENWPDRIRWWSTDEEKARGRTHDRRRAAR
jgi:hypothetical protein